MYDKNKFNWHELFNNSDGKTSGSAAIGLWFGLITGISFIAAMCGWFLSMNLIIEIFNIILKLGALSVGLLAVRKVSESMTKPKGPE